MCAKLELEINKYIQASNKVGNSLGGYLTIAIKSVWLDQSKDKNKDKKKAFNKEKATEISKCFWDNTESKFYELVKTLYDNVQKLTDEKRIELRREWYQHIKLETMRLFERWAFIFGIQTNPRRIADAHNKLLRNLNSNSLTRDILGLPQEDE